MSIVPQQRPQPVLSIYAIGYDDGDGLAAVEQAPTVAAPRIEHGISWTYAHVDTPTTALCGRPVSVWAYEGRKMPWPLVPDRACPVCRTIEQNLARRDQGML